jgi:hypothetical protein
MSMNHFMMRGALSLCCLLSFPHTFVNARAGALNGGRALVVQKAFRPYGYFSLVGKPPKGFENFDTIQYWRKEDEQTGPDISERMSGVNETGGVVYAYATISITRRAFVFTTRAVGGLSYKFSGRFLRSDFVGAEMNFERPVLMGVLDKYRNGKRVARATVRLSYFAGT